MEPRFVLTALVLTAALAGCLTDPQPGPGEGGAGSDAGPAALGDAVVAAAHRLAAEAGAEVLRDGGNAVDAAAAVQWALNVVEPEFSGVGGGSFLLLYLADGDRLVLVDGRETAPAGTAPDQYASSDDDHPDRMGYSTGVPGTVAAFDLAVGRWGDLGWARTFDPAIRLAEEGFEVYPYLSRMIATHDDELRSWPPSARLFLQGALCPFETEPCLGGAPLLPGQTLRQVDLARTFRALQAEGPGAFYNGSIGRAVADTVRVREGTMTAGDLAAYRPVVRDPVCIPYRDAEVCASSPPGGGVVVLQALGILEPLDLGADGRLSADGLHHLVEALRLAYADRAAHVADPAFVEVPTAGLLDPDYLAERRDRIAPDRTRDHPPGDPWPHHGAGNGSGAASDGAASGGAGNGSGTVTWSSRGGHTTHFSVVDHEGNVASVTSTIESGFGTGMVVPGWGFLLNDELTDFTWATGTINSPEPGKRPRSSTSPTIVLQDGRPVMAVGAPGGTTIPSTVVEVVLHVIEHGMELGDAVEAGRFVPRTWPQVLWDRELGDPGVHADLAGRGHRFVQWSAGGVGNVHALLLGPDGAWQGWADSRRHQGAAVVVEAPGR